MILFGSRTPADDKFVGRVGGSKGWNSVAVEVFADGECCSPSVEGSHSESSLWRVVAYGKRCSGRAVFDVAEYVYEFPSRCPQPMRQSRTEFALSCTRSLLVQLSRLHSDQM